eukprot:1521724-Rhodomonas_salina.6
MRSTRQGCVEQHHTGQSVPGDGTENSKIRYASTGQHAAERSEGTGKNAAERRQTPVPSTRSNGRPGDNT